MGGQKGEACVLALVLSVLASDTGIGEIRDRRTERRDERSKQVGRMMRGKKASVNEAGPYE